MQWFFRPGKNDTLIVITLNNLRAIIRGMIIDNDQLKVLKALRKDTINRLLEIWLPIAYRENDADYWIVSGDEEDIWRRRTEFRMPEFQIRNRTFCGGWSCCRVGDR